MKCQNFYQIVFSFLLSLFSVNTLGGESIKMNTNWLFSLGDASSMESDFKHGTEYFTYLAKAASSNGNRGPAWVEFDDSNWQNVTLPHDWVVDLPFSPDASHSHGYKQIGWKYPKNSVGWYRKHFFIPKEDEGKIISITFEGIYRDSEVYCNGFYLGHEPSGYATKSYRLSEYLNYGSQNVITVRCNASVEEGWYYEGAGIYRNVWLNKQNATHFKNETVQILTRGLNPAQIDVNFEIQDEANIGKDSILSTSLFLYDTNGLCVAASDVNSKTLTVINPHLWSVEQPYLYTLKMKLYAGNRCVDTYQTLIGIRTIDFGLKEGVLLNGKPIELKGVNLHLDHAGVGVGVSDNLWIYKIMKVKELGANAIRCSHNPASPSMLNACDKLGMLVIDENRLMGVNDEHLDLLRRMIERDRNHPSVILWSIGNEEWAIESGERGEKIAKYMTEFVQKIDSTRPTTYGNSGGFGLVKHVGIKGWNYIIQNDVENRHQVYPDWFVIGTEETSGCGTRNVYKTDKSRGWMESINRTGESRSDGTKNVIGRGWRFYKDNPWAGGLFYWTGFDYRGEPTPMGWPATGSQFGILDYCGNPKDEASYLKASWTNEPVLHVFPHWNLKGFEGDSVSIWAYANVDEVEIWQDGKSLGRKRPNKDDYFSWETIYLPGKLTAIGYVKGKKVITRKLETTGSVTNIVLSKNKQTLKHDGEDIAVIDVKVVDNKGREVPDACMYLDAKVAGDAEILGYGNGDPAFHEIERPQGTDKKYLRIKTFMGRAQIIVRSTASEDNRIQPIRFRLIGDSFQSELDL